MLSTEWWWLKYTQHKASKDVKKKNLIKIDLFTNSKHKPQNAYEKYFEFSFSNVSCKQGKSNQINLAERKKNIVVYYYQLFIDYIYLILIRLY